MCARDIIRMDDLGHRRQVFADVLEVDEVASLRPKLLFDLVGNPFRTIPHRAPASP